MGSSGNITTKSPLPPPRTSLLSPRRDCATKIEAPDTRLLGLDGVFLRERKPIEFQEDEADHIFQELNLLTKRIWTNDDKCVRSFMIIGHMHNESQLHEFTAPALKVEAQSPAAPVLVSLDVLLCQKLGYSGCLLLPVASLSSQIQMLRMLRMLHFKHDFKDCKWQMFHYSIYFYILFSYIGCLKRSLTPSSGAFSISSFAICACILPRSCL